MIWYMSCESASWKARGGRERVCRQNWNYAEIFAAAGTVQKALNRLTAEGFIHARGRLGTFVCDRPPHIAHIGVLFPSLRGQYIWHDTIAAAVEKVAASQHKCVNCFFDCHRVKNVVSPSLAQIEDDVVDGRLAAVILACTPAQLAGSLILNHPSLPRIWIGKTGQLPRDSLLNLQPPHHKAMRMFQSQNRKRLGLLTTFNFRESISEILSSAEHYGLLTHRRWTHFIDAGHHPTARGVAELLMSLPPDERPDALYITDDHLVHSASEGIRDAGVRVMEDLDIVAHANFPNMPQSLVPVCYLGFDIDEVVRTAMNLIDQCLAGQRSPTVIKIEPVFDFEIRNARRTDETIKAGRLPAKNIHKAGKLS